LLAEKLGISEHYVWRILRKHQISLARRRSWCISTDPEFVPKAAAIVGMYLDPPENAVVLCVDEKPAIQALERAQGWLKLPNGKALTGFNHEYKRNGTTTLFAALNVATGLVKTGHFKRRRRRQFLSFMNELVVDYPDQEIHVILDNLNTHKPKIDRWLPKHPNVHPRFVAQRGRDLVQHPMEESAPKRQLYIDPAGSSGHHRIHRSLQRNRSPFRVESHRNPAENPQE
jgi:hypothetical protein